MTTEQLMIKRVKCIAVDTSGKYKVGDIFYQYFFETPNILHYCYVTNPESQLQGKILKTEYAENMPHLFRKLAWWEGRDVKDMPVYLKAIKQDFVCKPIYHEDDAGLFYLDETGVDQLLTMDFIPATLEEYNQYNNQ